jgi:Cd2+/Zn2+-exporting ATPase
MKLLIKPGAQFPVDAEIFKGATAADESNLTGEAAPVGKNVGDAVLAGTINLWGAVEVLVTKPAAESALQKIIALIKDAQQQKAPAQQFTDKFSTIYTYFVLGRVAWRCFLSGGLCLASRRSPSAVESHSAFYRAMTLLVVSSPCALVLSIPSAVLAAIAWGARHGILFRGGAAVEKLAEINVVALDKTGTLTTGELRVEKVESFPPGRENEIARLAYSLEKFPRIRSPAPSRVTANKTKSSRSRSTILNPSPVRVCWRNVTARIFARPAGMACPRRTRNSYFTNSRCGRGVFPKSVFGRRRFAWPDHFARRHPPAGRVQLLTNCATKVCAPSY